MEIISMCCHRGLDFRGELDKGLYSIDMARNQSKQTYPCPRALAFHLWRDPHSAMSVLAQMVGWLSQPVTVMVKALSELYMSWMEGLRVDGSRTAHITAH